MHQVFPWQRLAVLVWLMCGNTALAADDPIPPAPPFTAKQLTALPTDGWVTNGGSLFNQRYSPLTLINTTNVKDLKAAWRASLKGSGVRPGAGNQGQPLVYEGVIYAMTADGDAFAIGVESGKLLWEYTANIDPAVPHPCCGWVARGLGMGEGKIFLGRLDAKLEALDQRTGKLVWSVQAEDPQHNYVIAGAPLYYNGLVIAGFAGSDMGAGGRVKAYEAKTGKLRWTFNTVPGPGEFGHDTWPTGSEVWKYAGAGLWQTPAIDPELGLVYFSTANPWPNLNAAIRPGDNLFSDSIVAIDAKTGAYRWHFQEVHHDLWDYDAANPVILFDAPYEGRLRKGIAQAGKTGWVYLLDRESGKPLIGIVETPVMQEPAQHTSPTQPYPIGDALVPQSIDIPPEGFELVNQGRIFTPYLKEPRMWKPAGAVSWPPSSYDRETNLMYICASDSSFGAQGEGIDSPIKPEELIAGPAVASFADVAAIFAAPVPHRDVFTALDVKTNRIAWHQQWIDGCRSGSMVTAGGLVFIGRGDGRLTALDKSNGKKLWEFQTDGGVNAPPTTFEYKGKQYVVVHAGGTQGTKLSDGLWLFSLDGTMASLPHGSADPAAAPAIQPPAAGAAPLVPGDAAKGKVLYGQICNSCHGETGRGGVHGGPAYTSGLTAQAVIDIVSKGRGQMPTFGAVYSPQQLQDLAAYVLVLKPKE